MIDSEKKSKMASTLPDIVREPKIVSGKDQKAALVSSLVASTSVSFDLALSDSLDNASLIENNHHNGSKVYVKTAKAGSKEIIQLNEQTLPNLISNDKNRSTAYRRLARSSDFLNVKNSPLATRYVYNWKPLERLTSKTVQAKVKLYKPPRRIETTARPSSPYKVKTDFETFDLHEHNQKRSLEMRRLQHLKEHTEWSIYPYAAIEEREQYNKRIRETLKEQIEQKDRVVKKILDEKILEYKLVAEQDSNSINEDKRKKVEKLKYLNTFRDENKQLMEDKWMHNYLLKRNEWQQESQLLEQDPVNWSKTLK